MAGLNGSESSYASITRIRFEGIFSAIYGTPVLKFFQCIQVDFTTFDVNLKFWSILLPAMQNSLSFFSAAIERLKLIWAKKVKEGVKPGSVLHLTVE